MNVFCSLQRARSLFVNPRHSIGSVVTRNASTNSYLAIHNLGPLPGSTKNRKRTGRGVGSGRGKNSGRGHQHSPSTPRGFEGGQTPLYKTLPKIGFRRTDLQLDLQALNLNKVQRWISMGRLKVPPANPPQMITMRHLVECGLITNPKDGVKLLSSGGEKLTVPIHLEVSRASASAIESIEKAGGTVTTVHFNKLAYRTLMKPSKFDIFPIRARPNPKMTSYYLNKDKSGYLSPEIQIRNLKTFGYVTSEEKMKDEHAKFMDLRRKIMHEDRGMIVEE